MAEINAEIEAAGRDGSAGVRTTMHSPAPLNVILPSGSVAGTRVSAPSSVADPVPPTPPVESLHVDSSSKEDIDIMPPAEEQPPERKPSKRRISVPSDSDDEPLIRRSKKKK